MKKFLSFLSFLLILAGCILVAFLVVWPLWKFATSSGKLYTICTLILASLALIFFIVKKILEKSKKGKANE